MFKFKADNKNISFPTQFCFASLNGNVYDFSVDYNSFDKFDILNIHKYLMTKNNIK